MNHLKNLIKKVEDKKKKRTLYHYLDRQEEAYKDAKVKSLVDFDEDVCSVKSLAIKKESKINLANSFYEQKNAVLQKHL